MIMSKKKIAIVALAAAVCFVAVGAGATYAMKQLTKQEEMALKQQMKPVVPVGERSVDMIGIFAPQFQENVSSYLAMYEKEYGKGITRVVAYKGYTLLIPPNKSEDEVEKIKAGIDSTLQSQEKATPSSDVQNQDIKKIRDVFGVKENIAYDSNIGAYVDERGFQYNFHQNQLVNKQEGVTPGLQQKFEKHYPHLAGSGSGNAPALAEDRAKAIAEGVIAKIFGADKTNALKSKAEISSDDNRLLIVYGDNEVRLLLDKVSGDIIYYGKNK